MTPDMTTLGKVIGGGMPVGAFGGPGRTSWNVVAPARPRLPGRHPLREPDRDDGGTSRRSSSCRPRASTTGCTRPPARVLEGMAEPPRSEARRAVHHRPTSAACSASSSPRRTEGAAAFDRRDGLRRRSTSSTFFHAMLERGVWLAPERVRGRLLELGAHGDRHRRDRRRGRRGVRGDRRRELRRS